MMLNFLLFFIYFVSKQAWCQQILIDLVASVHAYLSSDVVPQESAKHDWLVLTLSLSLCVCVSPPLSLCMCVCEFLYFYQN